MLPWETEPDAYEALFAAKCDRVEGRFAPFAAPSAQRFPSPVDSYRARAEFRMWHSGDDLDYVMFDPSDRRTPVPIDDFVPGLAPIRAAMPLLRQRLQASAILRRKLFQVEFMAARDGDLLVTLIYHRPLDESWEQAASDLAKELGLSIVGRSRKQKLVVGRDYIYESFTVGDRPYRYRQYEQSFAQPNAPVNERMLNWAWEQCADSRGDLLELYCGNGNFTLPLSTRFDQVIATELSKSGTRAAVENQRDNAIENLAIIRLSAEEVSQALDGVREFRRLAALPKALGQYQLETVFVDPPRSGLDDQTLTCVKRFRRIIYVSCNPDTLLANLEGLSATHRVSALAFFDQFPYTDHLESGVILDRVP